VEFRGAKDKLALYWQTDEKTTLTYHCVVTQKATQAAIPTSTQREESRSK